MAIGLVGRKAGMTRIFTDAGETVPVTVIEVLPNRVTQVKAQDKDGYRAVQVTYGTRRPSLLFQGRRRPLRARQCRPGQGPGGVPAQRCGQGRVQDRHRDQGRPVQGRREGRRHRHHHRQGLRRRHEAPQLRRPAGDPRRVGVAPLARLHRPAPDPGPRVQGQAHVRSHGRHAPHDREPEGRRGRHGAQPAPDPRRGARRRGRPGDRAPLAQGGAAGEAQDRGAHQGRQRRRRRTRPRRERSKP